jgi:Acetyl-CoA carboxylase, carboxyltransferase component (subunits alpha and beta)
VVSSKESGSDVNFAYPNTEIAVMGASGVTNILHRSADENEKQEVLNEYNELF